MDTSAELLLAVFFILDHWFNSYNHVLQKLIDGQYKYALIDSNMAAIMNQVISKSGLLKYLYSQYPTHIEFTLLGEHQKLEVSITKRVELTKETVGRAIEILKW